MPALISKRECRAIEQTKCEHERAHTRRWSDADVEHERTLRANDERYGTEMIACMRVLLVNRTSVFS